jgi:predicted AAA+ superfamily ATPase
MALSNRDRIGKALDQLRDGLLPYISRQLYDAIGTDWQDRLPPQANNLQDVAVLLKLFMDQWPTVFKRLLSNSDRAYVSELLEARNKWAHAEAMASDDVDRYLDTAVRLCRNINATEQAEAIRTLREELQQQVFADRARNRTRYQASIANEIQPGLQPWREVITPHPDVISGKYQQAEFAADLDLVQRGIGSSEYTDPEEFYRRTFITDGLKDLLRIALQRFNSQGGEPVIELQTNFGGGKTHSMLALYHLCSGVPLASLPGLDEVCSELGIHSVPKASRAVLVGTAFNPSKVDVKPDGTEVHTLWGELAWQLGGASAYAAIAESDQRQVPPGARALAALFEAHGPCLILLDEWVAYARNLVSQGDLPAGTFDAQLSFAQQLTEATKQVSNALLLISVPASRNEIGGSDGQIACDGLKNVVTRLAYQWRPATGNESFEIVRRRLFEPITSREAGANRDAVVRAFVDQYATNKADFPSEAREPGYRDLLTSAYPIHPELFERLYEDWSTLDRFQRTRGVLRLLALTIEGLWNGNSKDLLIMPSSMPIDDNDVKNELVRFLDNQWEPIISQDVDGGQSVPTRLDAENPNFGRVSACKRVARSLYMGTAPGANRERKGINDQRVKLACVMPGEPIAVFGDALRRLGDRGRYIQQDGDRYWIDTSPNLNRTAEDYRESYLRQPDELLAELNQLLAKEAAKRGGFDGVHAAQLDTSGIPDEPATRLVLLAAQFTHKRGQDASPACQWAASCLQSKGNSPRQFQNTLVFLAPDEQNLANLFQALADRRAWQRVVDEELLLNLTVNQKNQAAGKIQEATYAIAVRIPETWCHLLVPYQSEPGPHGANWDEKRLSGGKGSLAERASEKCIQEDLLAVQLGARPIRDKLNAFLWRDRPHVQVRELVEWCRKYLYLPRISSDQVILDALVSGQAALSGESTFHLADNCDEATGRYSGLRPQQASGTQLPTLNSLVVKDEVALAQLETDRQEADRRQLDLPTGQTITTTGIVSLSGASSGSGSLPHNTTGAGSGTGIGLSTAGGGGGGAGGGMVAPPKPQLPTRYVASVKLDPTRASLQMSAFVEEVMSHLQALPGAQIEMTLEVQVNAPGGIDESTARIVLENSAALKVEKPGLY